MSEETTRNFWDVMRSFQWPEPEPISYRLYHDEDGTPIIYTMEALPGAYIEVDQETYTRASHHVRVRDGKLIVLQPKTTVTKLTKDPHSGMPCDTRDVCVVVDEKQAHTKWTKISNDID
jgi:hypothetical protein